MGDTGAVQPIDLVPQLREQLLGDLLTRQIGERCAVDEFHHQHHRTIRRLEHAVHRRHVDSGPLGHHADQRLVFDGLLQRRSGTHVADIS